MYDLATVLTVTSYTTVPLVVAAHAFLVFQ